jgi:hypothetical protein
MDVALSLQIDDCAAQGAALVDRTVEASRLSSPL